MSGGGGGAGGGKGAAAAGPVPTATKKMVQSLKEIVNRPDAEIYSALRECGMDPDEAVSRLLSQDTFQEVKSKRDKKKEVKETPEPRSRTTSNATIRGVRGGADRATRNGSVHSSSADNVTSRSSISGPGVPSMNSTQKQMVPSSSVNKNMVADGPSVPLQQSSGFQNCWSGTPGQLSMADIVKMGRPQGKPSSKPVATTDKGYSGQYPSLPSTTNHEWKQSVNTVPPPELDQGLPSVQDSILVQDHSHSVADHKQTYDNDWSPQDEPPSGTQSSFPDASVDPSLYEAPLQSSTLFADVVNSYENSHLDASSPAAIRSVNASEIHLEQHEGNSEYNDGLLQNSNSYLPQKHSHTDDETEESHVDVSANLQGLSLHDKELLVADDNPAVIIPDHLQVTSKECAKLSFGSFESGAFSGLVPPKSTDSIVDLPVVEESASIDQIEVRDQDYYGSGAVNSSANENLETIIGANMENLDVPSVSHPDVLRQEVLDDPTGLQYNLPSVSSHAYANPTQPSTLENPQGNTQAHTLSHLSSLLQANSLQSSFLRDLDFNISNFVSTQSMPTKYNSAAPTTTAPAISMQEALKPGAFSNMQSAQNLPSTNIPTGPPLPQQLAVHPYSQPTLPLPPFANMIGYPYLAQNYTTYLPSATFQQAYSNNVPFHQSATAVPGAGMKYSMPPQYKSNLSATSLQQQPSSVISGYGGFGSSSNLPTNFNLNQNATSPSTNLGFDEALSTQYKDAGQYMAHQQGENSAMWLHGAGSRAAAAGLPSSHFYGYQGQSQQGGFRQGQQLQHQQPSQFGGHGHGYPAFYHFQSGLTQEHPQNPNEGGLNGFQAAPSQPSHQSWQQHPTY